MTAEAQSFVILFFFTATADPELYPLSLHDALPISPCRSPSRAAFGRPCTLPAGMQPRSRPGTFPTSGRRDRKSTRLNSSHVAISYAVFCLKKKKNYSGMNSPYVLHQPCPDLDSPLF